MNAHVQRFVARRKGRWLSRTALSLGLLATGACGSAPADSEAGERIPFIAVGKDFNDFRTWPSNTIDGPATETTHIGGMRTVYINRLPAIDASAFPLGTMIVKEAVADGKLFARAKRGGGYNTTGAVDWEWFELEEKATGVAIRWRGFGPPLGEAYGGDATGGCNVCHKTVPANDYVLATWPTLGTPAPTDSTAVPDAGTSDPLIAAKPRADAVDEEASGAP